MVQKKNSNELHFPILVNPVPASRPRQSRWGGVHYGKKYTQYRKDAELYLSENPPPVIETFDCPVELWMNHVVTKARTSKLIYPNPDIDNFDKAVMDAITSYTNVWTDDKIVVASHTFKNFLTDEHPKGCGTYITVRKKINND